MNKQELLVLTQVVKNENVDNANTATRIGTILEEIVNSSINKEELKQTAGEDPKEVMSQGAVSDALGNRYTKQEVDDKLLQKVKTDDVVDFLGNDPEKVINQKVVSENFLLKSGHVSANKQLEQVDYNILKCIRSIDILDDDKDRTSNISLCLNQMGWSSSGFVIFGFEDCDPTGNLGINRSPSVVNGRELQLRFYDHNGVRPSGVHYYEGYHFSANPGNPAAVYMKLRLRIWFDWDVYNALFPTAYYPIFRQTIRIDSKKDLRINAIAANVQNLVDDVQDLGDTTVSVVDQELTTEQKGKARQNIGAFASDNVVGELGENDAKVINQKVVSENFLLKSGHVSANKQLEQVDYNILKCIRSIEILDDDKGRTSNISLCLNQMGWSGSNFVVFGFEDCDPTGNPSRDSGVNFGNYGKTLQIRSHIHNGVRPSGVHYYEGYDHSSSPNPELTHVKLRLRIWFDWDVYNILFPTAYYPTFRQTIRIDSKKDLRINAIDDGVQNLWGTVQELGETVQNIDERLQIGACVSVRKNEKIMICGASFSQYGSSGSPVNGFFELMCNRLELTPVNRFKSSIILMADAMLDADETKPHGSLFMVDGVDVFAEVNALVIMHVHNQDVLLSESDYIERTVDYYKENGISNNYANAFDYVIKQYKQWCAEYSTTRTYPGTSYQEVLGTKECQIILCSHWLPSRKLYNNTSRELARRFNLSYCDFDVSIGIAENDTVYCVQNTDDNLTPTLDNWNKSLNYAGFVAVSAGKPIGKTEVIDGVTWGWHPQIRSATYNYGNPVEFDGTYYPDIQYILAGILCKCISVM